MSQRDQRIDTCRASRRKPARQKCVSRAARRARASASTDRMLEKQDQTHYRRTTNAVEVTDQRYEAGDGEDRRHPCGRRRSRVWHRGASAMLPGPTLFSLGMPTAREDKQSWDDGLSPREAPMRPMRLRPMGYAEPVHPIDETGAEVNSQFSSTFHRQVLSSTASSQQRGLFILPGATNWLRVGPVKRESS